MALRPLQPADLFNFQAAGDAQLSPDGQWIAYVVQRSDYEKEKSYTDIYLASVAGQPTRRLTSTGNNTSPRFSPDGKRLAFSSSRSEKSQIWILDLDGGEAWQLPTEEEVGGFYWLPDSKQIAYTAKAFSKGEDWVPYPGAPEGDKERLIQIAKRNGKPDKKDDKKPNEIKVITRFRYRVDGIGYLGDVRRQVFVTPVPDSAPMGELKPAGKQITSGDFDHNDPTLSPDGRYLVVASRHTDTADYDHKVDLWLYDLADGQAHLLYDAPGPTGNPCWSPTGRLIAFTGHDNAVNVSTTNDLWLLDVSAFVQALADGQEPAALTCADAVNVTRPLDRPVGANGGSEVGYRGGSSMFWHDEELYFLMSDRGAAGIYKTTSCGKVTPIKVDYDCFVSSIHGRPDCLVYTATRPDQPEEIYVGVGGEEKAIAHVNDQLLSEVALGKWEKIVCPSDDGQPVDGWIVYPIDYEAGKKYPLVLLVHGGPHAAYGPTFMFAAHMFAGAGYAVVYTNPRGSQTYGQQFACCIDKNWGDRDFADVMAGVDAVIAKGVADPDRMFVHGWSYGGYWTCWAVTQTKRFKAACAGASVSNMLSDYGTSDITWADEHEYGGQPWADAAHLLRHSPISHVRNVETPILLLHGEGDLRCPISQTEEFYTALKRLGKTAVMVRYPGEFHGPRRPLHRLDRYQRILAWFGHFAQK